LLIWKTSIAWSNRWDLFFINSDPKIHWYGIINSVILVGVLSIVVGVILAKTLHRDIETYNDVDKVLISPEPVTDCLGGSGRCDRLEIGAWRYLSQTCSWILVCAFSWIWCTITLHDIVTFDTRGCWDSESILPRWIHELCSVSVRICWVWLPGRKSNYAELSLGISALGYTNNLGVRNGWAML
jgi:hypothetical protein